METRDAYNKWAASYDTIDNKTRDLEEKALKIVLKDGVYDDILELGCGTGKNTGWLASICNNLTAADFSEEMLRMAKLKHDRPNIIFKHANITKQWEFRTVDLLTCSLVLEHIRDIDHIFKQAYLTLNNSGKFYICELHPYKQLQGSRAKFELNGKLIELEYFVHHLSDFFIYAKNNGFICIDMQEWFDDDHKQIPRLCSFLFEKK